MNKRFASIMAAAVFALLLFFRPATASAQIETDTIPILTQEEPKKVAEDDQSAAVVRKEATSDRRRRGTEQEKDSKDKGSVSVRLKNFNERLKQDTDNVPWKRIIYRQLDLDSASNAVLYYPPRPTELSQNFFTILFRLINSGAIKAYEYIDGYESFDKSREIKFDEFLDRFGILATHEGGEEAASYKVADADIPSDLIKSYYVKEEYYFDPINSTIDIRVLALSPILYDDTESTETLKFPLFWVKYDDVRPYLSSKTVMLSDLNNADDMTLDSYFRLGLYNGKIYKTLNLRGLALAQYCPTPDSLYAEQQRIEKELHSFERTLWSRAAQETQLAEDKLAKEDEDDTSEEASSDTGEARTARARRQLMMEGNTPKATAPKSKAPKAAKAKKQKRATSTKRSARSRF